jgi:hypothetical protein
VLERAHGKVIPHTGLQIKALKLKGSSCISLLHVTPVHLHLTLLNRELHSISATHRKVSTDVHIKAVPHAWLDFTTPHVWSGGLSPGHTATKHRDLSLCCLSNPLWGNGKSSGLAKGNEKEAVFR